ncbi:MAG: hypothetical protein M1836_005797 [Candelina mexicana]|nr:MAG: hypothetical protein M1836_005797 [Candelina mexicana]
MSSGPPTSYPTSKDLPHPDEFELESNKTWPTEDPLGINQTLEEINGRGPSIDDVYDSASGTFVPRLNAAAIINSEDNINTETGPNRCGPSPMTKGLNSRSGNPSISPPIDGSEELLDQNLSYFDQAMEAILGCGTQGSFAEDDGQGLPVYDPHAAPVDDSDVEVNVDNGTIPTHWSNTQGRSESMKTSVVPLSSTIVDTGTSTSSKRKASRSEQYEQDLPGPSQKRARVESTAARAIPAEKTATSGTPSRKRKASGGDEYLESSLTQAQKKPRLETTAPPSQKTFAGSKPSVHPDLTNHQGPSLKNNDGFTVGSDSHRAIYHHPGAQRGLPFAGNQFAPTDLHGAFSTSLDTPEPNQYRMRGISRYPTGPRNVGTNVELQGGAHANGMRISNGPIARPHVLGGTGAVFPRDAVARRAPVARIVASPAISSRSQPAAIAHPPPVASPALAPILCPPSAAGSTSVQSAGTTATPIPSSRKRKAPTEDQTGQYKKAKTEESPNVEDNDTDTKPTQGKRVGTKRGGYAKTPAHMYEWTDPVTGRKPKIQKDFPTPDQPLPRGRSYDYIMTHYPNHVDGLLCLEMYDRGITAGEMARKSGGNRFNHTNYVHRCKSLVEKRFPLRNWEVEKHCKWDRAKKAQVYVTDLQPYGVAHPRELLPFPGSATHMLAGPRYQTPQEEQDELLRIQRKQQQDSQVAQHHTVPPTQVPQQQMQSTSQNSPAETQAGVDLNAPHIPSGMPDDSFSSGVDGHEGSLGDDQIDNLDEDHPQDGYFPQDTIYDSSDGEDQVEETSEDAWLIQLLSEANRALDQQNGSSSESNGERPSLGKYPEPGWGTPHGQWDNFGNDPNGS